MDSILSSGLGYGACLSLLGVFLIIAGQRARPEKRGRFVLLSAGSALWFGANLGLSVFAPTWLYAPERPPLHSLLWTSAGALPFLLTGFVFYRGMPAVSPRQTIARRDFAALLAAALAIGFVWFWAWGWPGHSQPAYRAPQFPGVLIAGLLPVVYGFIVTVNPLVHVWRLFRRVVFYLALCFAAALLIYGALDLYFRLGVAEAAGAIAGESAMVARGPGLFFLYFVFLVIAVLMLSIAILHHTYLKATLQYIFFRDVYSKEKVLNEFVNEVQAMDSSRENQDSLLEIILQNVYRVFNFEKGFIVAAAHSGFAGHPGRERRARHIGPPPARLGFDRAPFLRLRLSDEFVRELDQAILLEDDFPEPFAFLDTDTDTDAGLAGENIAGGDSEGKASGGRLRRHRRVAQRIRESLRGFREEGYTLFLPLIFRGEIWGALFLGPKADALPYFNGERKLLESARMAFAMALRNNAVIEEREIKVAEQFQSHSYAAPQPIEAQPVTRVKLGDRSLVFTGEAMHRLVDRTRRIATSILPVLIQGETGAGKELIARLLHHDGPGPGAPFVAVNCAAIPATLWESEIFGYRKGAFTGATADHPGLVEQAAGGVLFFDEIGEMPLDIQPKILRLIQEKKFQAVGGKRLLNADCRLVFATHRDLAAMSQSGEFREDLYYRINVHRLGVPPLRDRQSDIPSLVQHMLEQYAREHGFAGRSVSPAAMERLVGYGWPGNIRELENLLIRLLAEGPEEYDAQGNGPPVEVADLPRELQAGVPARRSEAAVEARAVGAANGSGGRTSRQALFPEPEAAVGFEKLMQDYARELIAHTLKVCKGNRTHAARRLGISRGKLIYQIKELGIAEPVTDD